MSFNIGFIGYGKMARAIAKYLKQSGYNNIYASDKFATEFAGANECSSNDQLVKKCDIIFLSVKPQNSAEAMTGLDFSGKILISIMAGSTIETLRLLASNVEKIVRVMPNLCASVGKSVNAYSSFGLSDEEEASITNLLSVFGFAYKIAGNQFDAVTGLTGSSPAYAFRFAKNIIECGCEEQFDFETSRDMVCDMLSGCSEIIKNTASVNELQTLIENVCSKGGTTIEGIYKLDNGKFDETVKSAIFSAINRSRELSKK